MANAPPSGAIEGSGDSVEEVRQREREHWRSLLDFGPNVDPFPDTIPGEPPLTVGPVVSVGSSDWTQDMDILSLSAASVNTSAGDTQAADPIKRPALTIVGQRAAQAAWSKTQSAVTRVGKSFQDPFMRWKYRSTRRNAERSGRRAAAKYRNVAIDEDAAVTDLGVDNQGSDGADMDEASTHVPPPQAKSPVQGCTGYRRVEHRFADRRTGPRGAKARELAAEMELQFCGKQNFTKAQRDAVHRWGSRHSIILDKDVRIADRVFILNSAVMNYFAKDDYSLAVDAVLTAPKAAKYDKWRKGRAVA